MTTTLPEAEVIGGDGRQAEAADEREARAEAASDSVLSIAFAGQGSAVFRVSWRNVAPTQILAAGQWLVARATRLLNEQWTMEAVQQQREAAELAQVQELIRGKVA